MDKVALPQAIVYARRSQKQDNAASVTDQVAAGRAACGEYGWHVAEVIDQDDDRSASRFARRGRPGWERLLASLRAGLAGVVVLWESSRGDRKLSEWATFLDECRDRHIRIHVISHDQTYDLRKARDWKALADDGVDSAYESEKISGRVRRGMTGAALRGEPYALAPYGYRAVYDPSTGKRTGWIIVPERAEIVREIIYRVAHHESLKAICRDLVARGVPTARGAQWSEQQVRRVAMNPAYAALLLLPDGELIDGQWPAIVSRAAWNDAMAVLRPRLGGKRPGGARHMLTHLANCECGSLLVIRKSKYSCPRGHFYIDEVWLDEFIRDVICERLSRPDARDLFKRDDDRSAILRNEVAELQAQLDQWAAASVSVRAYQVKEADLLPKIERRQREIDALTIPPALADILSADDVRAAWETYTVQARRAILATVTGITVKRAPGGRGAAAPGPERVAFTWQPARRGGK
jgi:site-specific DNA recombinase